MGTEFHESRDKSDKLFGKALYVFFNPLMPTLPNLVLSGASVHPAAYLVLIALVQQRVVVHPGGYHHV
jgi:hypothetical protein